MNEFGRVSICGCISQYNLLEPATGEKRVEIIFIIWDSGMYSFVNMACYCCS